MKAAPHHPSEASRLESLRAYEILDTELDQRFQQLAEQATTICGSPVGLITFVDGQRQWFKARVGVDVQETPRELSFCAHAILQDGVFVVPDARLDERFHDNPLVTGPAQVVFYAGMPVRSRGGQPLGTICAVDTVPRALDDAQRAALRMLARQVEVLLESRQRARLAITAAAAQPSEDQPVAGVAGTSAADPTGAEGREGRGVGRAQGNAPGPTIASIRNARAWASCRATVAAALADFFQKPLRPHAEWSADHAMRIATMVQLDTAHEVALTLDLRIEPAFLRAFASQLFGRASDEQAEKAVLFESANIVMGAVKRAFEAEGFRPSTGLPRERSAVDVGTDLARAEAAQFQLFDVEESLVAVTLGLTQRHNHTLPISQLTEGMVAASDVRDAGGKLVTSRGTRLTAHIIRLIADASPSEDQIAVGGVDFV
jgi:GAF domain-containing protein